MKKLGLGTLASIFAISIVLGGSVGPANAAVTSVSGSITCAAGQTARVSVTTNNYASVKFYRGSTLVYTSTPGSTHGHNYGVRTLSWKVTSTDIAYANDFCSSATFAAD